MSHQRARGTGEKPQACGTLVHLHPGLSSGAERKEGAPANRPLSQHPAVGRGLLYQMRGKAEQQANPACDAC